MKKTLVALAALASISAFAQSTVTLYGGIDTGAVSLKADDGTTTTSRNYTGGNAGYTSRIGFTGTEDLGGGTKATFTIETALGSIGAKSTDNGAYSTSNGGNSLRTGKINLSNDKNGEFSAGWQMQPRHLIAGAVAQNDFSLPGNLSQASSLGGSGTNYGTTGGAYSNGDYALRANSLSYTTPSFNGFTATVGTALSAVDVAGATANRQLVVTNATDAQTTDNRARAQAYVLAYTAGPLTLIGSQTNTSVNGLAGTGYNVKNNVIAATYVLGPVKFGALNYSDKAINDVAATQATNDVANKGSVLSVRGTVYGNFEALALYSTGKYQLGNAAASLNRDQKGSQVAGFYNFSKRTAAYIARGVQTRQAAAVGGQDAKDVMSTIGIRHNF